MADLNFKMEGNSEAFIREAEQVQTAIGAIAEQTALSTNTVNIAVQGMRQQIGEAMNGLHQLSVANQVSLENGNEPTARSILAVDINKQRSELTQLRATLDGLHSGLSGVKGAFSAASAAAQLFSIDNNALEAAIQKVQTALAVVNGLQQAHTALSRDSAFQINVVGRLKTWWRTITLQAAAAQGIETAAATTGTGINLGLAGAFRAVGLAIRSIPVFGWIVTGISALAGVYALWSSRTGEVQERNNALSDSIRAFGDNVQNHASQPIATIEQLSMKFQALGNDMAAKQQFIADNKKAFDDLGVSIHNVHEAQRLLVDNKDAFVEAQMAKAVSLAYLDKMQEEAKKYVDAKTTAAQWEEENTKQDHSNRPKPRNKEEFEFATKHGLLGEDGRYITVMEGKAQAANKAAEEARQNMQEMGKQWLQSSKEADELMRKLGVTPPKRQPTPKPDNTQQEKREREAKEREEQERLAKEAADLQKKKEAEKQAMLDYLKNYGTYQQQRLAIAQEYAEKIRKATKEHGADSIHVKTLEKEQQKSFAKHETAALQANIDWVTVFSEFGGIASNFIQPELDKAKAYTQTDEFKNTDAAAQATFMSSIQKMESILGESGGNSFKKLGQDVQAYQNSLHALNNAKAQEAAAIERLIKAQEDYNQALEKGTQAEQEAAKETLDVAKKNANEAMNNVSEQTDTVRQNNQNLSDTATGLKKNMDDVTQGLTKLSSGSLSGAYSGIIQASNGIKDAIGKTSDSLQEVPIVGWILSIIDVLKDGLSNLIGGLLDAIFSAVSGILKDVLSGDLFVTVAESLLSGVTSIFDAISFGGFSSLMDSISGSNAKEVQETIDRLTDRNEILGKSIDRLTKVMDKEAGIKAISAYQDAKAYQKEQNDNYLNIAKTQASYNHSHHSWNYYMDWTPEQLAWARKNVDANFSGTESLWGLTPEQMNILLSNADIYDQITSAGKGNYGGRVMEDLEAYADQAGKIEELTDKLHSSLMQISFDSLRDSFLDSLMDMDKGAKEFSEDFSGYLQRALLNFAIGDLLDEQLQGLYTKIATDIEEGTLTENKIDLYRSEWDGIVQQGTDIRDGVAEITGYGMGGGGSSSQTSTNASFQTMSQDTGSELSGRFTALQISNEEIKNSMLFALGNLAVLCTTTSDNNLILSDMRNLAVISNGHLEDIAKHTKVIQGFGEKLDNIDRNTKNL